MANIHHLEQADNATYKTIDEAADILGIKSTSVRNYMALGKFRTYRFKNSTLIHIDEIRQYQKP